MPGAVPRCGVCQVCPGTKKAAALDMPAQSMPVLAVHESARRMLGAMREKATLFLSGRHSLKVAG